MDTTAKLFALRTLMQKQGLDAYVQPVHDEYMSEYPPACARRVEWLCGFTGSAGTVAITADRAAMLVDGRYTLQAAAEVDGALFETHNSAAMPTEDWLAKQLKAGQRVGYDAKLYTPAMLSRLQAKLAKKQIICMAVENLVDAVWAGRPAAPANPVFIHELRFAGEDSASKRERVAKAAVEAGADVALITAPDAVNWLLNVRGSDVQSSPLALGVATIDADARVEWFVEPSRVNDVVRAHLGNGVSLVEPSQLAPSLAALGEKTCSVLADPQSTPVWFTQQVIAAGGNVIEAQDPCLLPKAMKNPTELAGIRAAHARDGAAIVKLLSWLESELAKRPLTEMDVVAQLLAFRKEAGEFVEPSFNTIAGSGPNGAIVHYRATDKTNRALKQGELLLLDSGGQYLGGTTDITRTIAIGNPSAEHKDRFTRVLKGHIALATVSFPEGTSGSQLDALARQYLWQAGLDYDHGTGHGVGCFLNVHEGPQRISKRGGDAPLKPGMVISNEPGYYKTGEYGIRIENLVAVMKPPAPYPPSSFGGGVFMSFETLTCAPIDRRLVDAAMLGEAEKNWLNHYHGWVKTTLSPQLGTAEKAWLEAACEPI